jgi:hypothetical protein
MARERARPNRRRQRAGGGPILAGQQPRAHFRFVRAQTETEPSGLTAGDC